MRRGSIWRNPSSNAKHKRKKTRKQQQPIYRDVADMEEQYRKRKKSPKIWVIIMRGSRGGGGQWVRTPWKSQNIGFLSNTGPDPLKNHKATCTMQALNVESSLALAGGPMLARYQCYLDPLSSHQTKTSSELDPLWQNILDLRMIIINIVFHFVQKQNQRNI